MSHLTAILHLRSLDISDGVDLGGRLCPNASPVTSDNDTNEKPAQLAVKCGPLMTLRKSQVPENTLENRVRFANNRLVLECFTLTIYRCSRSTAPRRGTTLIGQAFINSGSARRMALVWRNSSGPATPLGMSTRSAITRATAHQLSRCLISVRLAVQFGFDVSAGGRARCFPPRAVCD
jgi:hypothetical protein